MSALGGGGDGVASRRTYDPYVQKKCQDLCKGLHNQGCYVECVEREQAILDKQLDYIKEK